jgi:RNA polymerase subunit RPABC4/transcription elongation factor Spt4
MVEPLPPVDHASAVACPWCSTAVTAETAVCPSCNAILISDEEHDLPGVTSVDEGAVREKRPVTRGRFLSWLAGEAPDQPSTVVDVQAIAPPDVDVQREILRLELEAQISNLQAEADSMKADALVEGRGLPEGLQALEAAEAGSETTEESRPEMAGSAAGAESTADATTA